MGLFFNSTCKSSDFKESFKELDNHSIKERHVLSIAGTGLKLAYTFGTIKWLYEKECHKKKDVCFLGASGGAWAALVLAANLTNDQFKIGEWANDIIQAIEKYPYLKGLGNLEVIFRQSKIFKDLLSIEDLYKKVQGRLMITLTRHPLPYLQSNTTYTNSFCSSGTRTSYLKSECITRWESNRDLLECVLTSCFLPALSIKGQLTRRWGNKYYGEGYYFDGATNFKGWQPIPLHPKTLTKIHPYLKTQRYPFYWPLDQINIFNNSEWHKTSLEQGYQDAEEIHQIGFWSHVL